MATRQKHRRHFAALYSPYTISSDLSSRYLLSIAKALQSLDFNVVFLFPSLEGAGIQDSKFSNHSGVSLSSLSLLQEQIREDPSKRPLIFVAMGPIPLQPTAGIGKNLNIFHFSEAHPSSLSNPETLGTYDIVLVEEVSAQKLFFRETMPGMELLLRRGRTVPQTVLLSLNSTFDEKLCQLVNRALVGKTFKKFTLETLGRYRSLPASHQSAASTAQNGAVIVETSSHWAFEYVCRNVMYHLGAHWSLLVFHGENNEAFVRTALRGIPNIQFRRLSASPNAIEDYNDMMKSADFWNQIDFDKVLLFQTDSILLHGKIGKYLKYDYIGAPWDPKDNVRVRLAIASGALNSTVGNGGLSLRSVVAMKGTIRQFSQHASNEQEDVFFAKYLSKAGYKLGTIEDANTFCVEVDVFHGKDTSNLGIFALHAPWYYMPRNRYLTLLKSSLPSWTSALTEVI